MIETCAGEDSKIVVFDNLMQSRNLPVPSSPKTLIIVDPCVRDFVGHHLEYNEAIVRAAEQAGLRAVTLGHRDMPADVQRRINGGGCFSHDIWKRFPALARISP